MAMMIMFSDHAGVLRLTDDVFVPASEWWLYHRLGEKQVPRVHLFVSSGTGKPGECDFRASAAEQPLLHSINDAASRWQRRRRTAAPARIRDPGFAVSKSIRYFPLELSDRTHGTGQNGAAQLAFDLLCCLRGGKLRQHHCIVIGKHR